jgi:hypothetical protein
MLRVQQFLAFIAKIDISEELAAMYSCEIRMGIIKRIVGE